ncbi:MAG: copper amine oxidase N-terminal domain-containing protein [Clostridiales bacterium]|jgi:hypothetical protein|nr:copper amine oxidase N-terminal domain-containing protein [Clostridiales bacterium]
MKSFVVKAILPLGLILAVSHVTQASELNSAQPLTDWEIGVGEVSVEAQSVQPGIAAETVTQPESSHYISVSGTISEMDNTSVVNRILVDGDNGGTFFNIGSDTLVYSLNSFERVSGDLLAQGQSVSVFYNVTTPQTLSFPPMINPEIIVIHDSEEMAFAKVDYFNEDLISSDNTLKLNLSEEVLVVGQDNSIRNFGDASDKNLLVFYDITTRSIPAQTAPIKIVILDSPVVFPPNPVTPALPTEEPKPQPEEPSEDVNSPADDVILALGDEDFVTVNGVRFVPLYKLAEILGYELEWNPNTAQITMRKPGTSAAYTLLNGNTEYGFNRAMFRFTNAPFIQDGRTYVEESFIDVLVQE